MPRPRELDDAIPAIPERPGRLHEEAEILDRPGLAPALVERSLVELARVNRWLLGHRPVRRTLLPRIAAGPRVQRLLDVGTGSGDVAAGVARGAARRGRRLSVVGVDRKLSHLLVGRRLGRRQLRVVADARALPFRRGSFDWSLSTLFFHHFDAPTNRAILGEMQRVSTRGAVVVDLRASRFGRWIGGLVIPLLGVGPVTRHDGRVSLARAWRLPDVRRLTADLPVAEISKRHPFRFALVLDGSR